jgi:hypothetical protein
MSGEERADGSLRVVYAASIRSCRPCPLREQCQWNGSATAKSRQVSVLLHPLVIGSEPILWRDWNRRSHRRACMRLHSQRLEVQMESTVSLNRIDTPLPFSRGSARALSPQFSRTAHTQCTRSRSLLYRHQAVRHPRGFRSVPRLVEELTRADHLLLLSLSVDLDGWGEGGETNRQAI